MDGGWIIEVAEDGERLRLWVCNGMETQQEAAVLVLKPPGRYWPRVGDEIRWRRAHVIWRRRGLPEVVLTRLCFSYDPRPTDLGTSYR